MKTLAAIGLFLFASTPQLSAETFSQMDTVQTTWVAHYSGPDSSDEVTGLILDAAGNVYITGESRNQDNTFDYVTAKYNSSGVQQWASRYDFSGRDDESTAIAVDGAGNVYVTGTSDGGATIFDIATIKYNAQGVQQWLVRYNGAAGRSDFASGMTLDTGGNVYVAGGSRVSTNSQLHYDMIVVKYNSFGVQQQLVSFNQNVPVLGDSDDFARALALDNDGNIYVTGTSELLNQVNIATVKYNSAGVQQWAVFYNGPGLSFDEPYALVVDGLGNAYVAGTSQGSGSGDDIVLLKYDATGVEQWAKRYTGSGNNPDAATGMALDASGNIFVTGSTNVAGNNNFVTIKYNPNGDQQWIVFYDSPAKFSDGANALALDQAGNVYVSGSSMSQSLSTDFLTIKYNGAGIQQWVARYAGTDNFDVAKAIAVDGSNNVIVSGQSLNIGATTIKYAQIPATSVEDESTSRPMEFSLWQNYPNPFNPSTTICFDLPRAGDVTLRVYNVVGQEIEPLVDEVLPAGSYKINWRPEGIASGVYFYRLQAGEFVNTKKFVLLK